MTRFGFAFNSDGTCEHLPDKIPIRLADKSSELFRTTILPNASRPGVEADKTDREKRNGGRFWNSQYLSIVVELDSGGPNPFTRRMAEP